ncbi:unnamed protein product [Amoebophrya sp. A120]|nr:unnamed protein product [Amoebophrya sp. A120]|eukprot:GSA120T00016331001.1
MVAVGRGPAGVGGRHRRRLFGAGVSLVTTWGAVLVDVTKARMADLQTPQELSDGIDADGHPVLDHDVDYDYININNDEEEDFDMPGENSKQQPQAQPALLLNQQEPSMLQSHGRFYTKNSRSFQTLSAVSRVTASPSQLLELDDTHTRVVKMTLSTTDQHSHGQQMNSGHHKAQVQVAKKNAIEMNYAKAGHVLAVDQHQALNGGQHATSQPVQGGVIASYEEQKANPCHEQLLAMVVGFFIFFLAFPTLFANEHRQAKMWELFSRAENILHSNCSADDDIHLRDRQFVHMQGNTTTNDVLKDDLFGVEVTNCAMLKRQIQMLQWVITERTVQNRDTGRDEVTVHANLEWRSEPVDNAGKRGAADHLNPSWPEGLPPGENVEYAAVFFGKSYILPKGLVKQMGRMEAVDLGGIGNKMEDKDNALSLPTNKPVITVAGKTFTLNPLLQGRSYYACGSGSAAGDFRVFFEKCPCTEVTIMAVADAAGFVPLLPGFYTRKSEVNGIVETVVDLDSPDGCCSSNPYKDEFTGQAKRESRILNPVLYNPTLRGDEEEDGADGTTSRSIAAHLGCCSILCCCCNCIFACIAQKSAYIYELKQSKTSAEQMLNNLKDKQQTIALCLRWVGLIMFFVGARMMLSVFPFLMSYVPLVGGCFKCLADVIVTIAAICIAVMLWMLTVAMAWLWYHPMYATAMFCIVGTLIAIAITNHTAADGGAAAGNKAFSF